MSELERVMMKKAHAERKSRVKAKEGKVNKFMWEWTKLKGYV